MKKLKQITLNTIILGIFFLMTVLMTIINAPTFLTAFLYSFAFIAIITLALKKTFPILAHVILTISSIIFSIQLITVALTGNYIDSVTLSNIGEYTALSLMAQLQILCTISIFAIGSICIKFSKSKFFAKTLLLLSVVLITSLQFYPPKNKLPVMAFIHTAYNTTANYYLHCKLSTPINKQQKKLYGKDYIVEDPEHHLLTEVPDLSNKNIILFFAEALSLKKIDLFNNYSDLTPNLSAFIKKSLYFDNYYNHTFATFLGLRGQLSSSYQYSGGLTLEKMNQHNVKQKFSTDIITLPQILNQNGYHTYFLSARKSAPSNLNTMLNTLGFDHVFTPEDFHSDNDLTDQQLFTNLTNLILQNKLQEPYFIAIYNLGTHFAEDSPDLLYHDGQNSLLNTTHNFDNAFGKWFNTLSEQLNIMDNLAIILTADHAALANPDYQQTFEHHPQTWVDKIPLAVYTAHLQPQTLDAKARNSLDLAPTILHMLRINKAKNYFLGCSLFKLYCPLPYNHYSVSKDIRYETTLEGVRYFNETWYPKHIFNRITDFYHLSESYTSLEASE